ncbi:1-phosphofructokinase family hexose kinase [Confluentibacter citreus]|uniref:1-phosphofructokinase family hexose kinase n=1 Tax=Confluentibacter citreus TaxID=2007307 RepID=UPI000C2958C7|nr:1-phosphofructokinase family hexose kinase [Confluentibacter citreus]
MNIITLTINPALDKSAKVDGLVPDQKLQCHSIGYQPGGGGINVSRVLNRLNEQTRCIFTSGGDTGKNLNELLLKEGINPETMSVKAWTRENLSIVDTKTNFQYRFGMPSHGLQDVELVELKSVLDKCLSNGDMLVLSGSLPPNVATDYYATLIQYVSNKNIRIVIDTSGPALAEALKEKVFLVKPNQKELAQWAGKEFLSSMEQEAFALDRVKSGNATYVVVSLGARGAFMASKDGIVYQSTPSVSVKSTIGAGDSMVAGLIYGIKNDFLVKDILKWGVVCGVATTMNEGTNLASKSHIDNVLKMMNVA